jgi:hypothetical protein
LWAGGAPQPVSKTAKKNGERSLQIVLPRALPAAGLEVTWGDAPRRARLEMRVGAGPWQPLDEDAQAPGAISYLATPQAHDISALRLNVQADAKMPTIRRLRLLSPTGVMTPMKRYQIAATRRGGELMPASLRQNQVYWTEVGIPGGKQKSVFDEWAISRHSRRHRWCNRSGAMLRAMRRRHSMRLSPIGCATAGCRCRRSSGRRNRSCC